MDDRVGHDSIPGISGEKASKAYSGASHLPLICDDQISQYSALHCTTAPRHSHRLRDEVHTSPADRHEHTSSS